VDRLEAAIRFEGFSVVDIWGICPGRYTKRNKLTPQSLEAGLEQLPSLDHFMARNARQEYGRAYREEAARLPPVPDPVGIEPLNDAPQRGRREVILLGSAGQRIVSAGEILCLAGAAAGLHATQKSDYPIPVMRGHSITEIILDQSEVDFTGIDAPSVVVALAREGVDRRRALFGKLSEEALILKLNTVEVPPCAARVVEPDFKGHHIKPQDWALAALAWLGHRNLVLTVGMLKSGLELRFKGMALQSALRVVDLVGDL
jgi:hypothetical protein